MTLWKRREENQVPVPEYYDEESPAATEMRRLARQLSSHEKELKSVLITSAIPSEGKSLLTAYLGIVLAHRPAVKSVVIVDVDLRRPKQHLHFGLERRPGVSEAIAGQLPPEVVMHETGIPNLKVVPCGQRKSSPATLWEGPEFHNLIEALKKDATYVLIDSPPAIPVTDVSLIAPHMDGVLMVALAGKTYREVIQRGLDVLEASGAHLIGLVLNNLQKVLPYYYDYNYYHYSPKSDSAEE